MRVSSWRTAISAVIWVLATLVDAQGYFYEPFTCSLSQNFEELGCYDVTGDPFTYALTNGYTGEDASRAYANYNTGGNNINSTVEANYCVQACRAHGFKYAALHNRACGCGTTLGSLVRSTDQTICYAVPDPNPCGGDRSENCGDPSGGGHARLFVDPSYESETSLIADGGTVVAGSYGYLGCFAKPNLPSNDANSDTRQTDSASCLAHCATSGYPLSYMYRDASNAADPVRCFCGTDFGTGARAYDDSVNVNPNNKCSVDCTNGADDCDPTSGTCCGDAGFQIYPIYANPRLVGCHIPRIPGYALIEQSGGIAIPLSTEYSCIATPASLSARRASFTQYSTGGVANPTVTRSASFVATATVTSAAITSSMIMYGCYNGGISSALKVAGASAVPAALGTPANIDVDKCANYCYSGGSDWAALAGPRTGTRCVCGDAVGDMVSGPIAMDYCNEPCQGTGSEENCGDANHVLLYALAVSATTGPWYTSYTSSITTRYYGCTAATTSTTSTATSTTSSSSTATSTSTDTTTSSATDTTTSSSSTGTTTSTDTTSSATDTTTSTSATGTTTSTDTTSSATDTTTSSSATDTTTSSLTDTTTSSTITTSSSTDTSASSLTDTTTSSATDTTTSSATDTTSSSTDTSASSSTDTTTSLVITTSSDTTTGSDTKTASDITTSSLTHTVTSSDITISSSTDTPTASSTESTTATSTSSASGSSSSAGETSISPSEIASTSTSSMALSTESAISDISLMSTTSSEASQTASITASTTDATFSEPTSTSPPESTSSLESSTELALSSETTSVSSAVNTASGTSSLTTETTFSELSTTNDSRSTSILSSPPSLESTATTTRPGSSEKSDSSSGAPTSSLDATSSAGSGQSTTDSELSATTSPDAATSSTAKTSDVTPTTSPSQTESESASSESAVSTVFSSSTSSTVDLASSTSSSAEPTFTVTTTEVQEFSSLFNTSDTPSGYAQCTDLEIHDPTTGAVTTAKYVIQYVGCFRIPPSESPFIGENATDKFRSNSDAGSKASSCAGFCAGDGESLSANNQGSCFCGETLRDTDPGQDRGNCDAPCPGSPAERCGGGATSQKRWLRRAADTYVNIIRVEPASQVSVSVQTNGTSTSSSTASGATTSTSVSGTGSDSNIPSTTGSTTSLQSVSVSPLGTSSTTVFTQSISTLSFESSSVSLGSETTSLTLSSESGSISLGSETFTPTLPLSTLSFESSSVSLGSETITPTLPISTLSFGSNSISLGSDTVLPTLSSMSLESDTVLPTLSSMPLESDTALPTLSSISLGSDTILPTPSSTSLESDTSVPTQSISTTLPDSSPTASPDTQTIVPPESQSTISSSSSSFSSVAPFQNSSLVTSMPASISPDSSDISSSAGPQTNSAVTTSSGPVSTVDSGSSPGSGFATSTSSIAPSVTDITTPLIIAVAFDNGTAVAKRDLIKSKRQAGNGGFVGGAGPINPGSCSDATQFILQNGELIAGGQRVATSPDVPFMPLRVNPQGTISTTFSVVGGTDLIWTNPAFFEGQAGFCQDPSGLVYATFAPAASIPVGCVSVNLVVILASQCQDGVVISVGPSVTPIPPATASTTGDSSGLTSTAGLPVLPENIFSVEASPTGEYCVETSLEWVPGQPTFIGVV